MIILSHTNLWYHFFILDTPYIINIYTQTTLPSPLFIILASPLEQIISMIWRASHNKPLLSSTTNACSKHVNGDESNSCPRPYSCSLVIGPKTSLGAATSWRAVRCLFDNVDMSYGILRSGWPQSRHWNVLNTWIVSWSALCILSYVEWIGINISSSRHPLQELFRHLFRLSIRDCKRGCRYWSSRGRNSSRS